MSYNNNDSFVYKGNDLVIKPRSDADYLSAMVAAIVAIEVDHPGTLAHVLRAMALSNAGWRITSSVTDSLRSMDAQRELADWIEEYLQIQREI